MKIPPPLHPLACIYPVNVHEFWSVVVIKSDSSSSRNDTETANALPSGRRDPSRERRVYIEEKKIQRVIMVSRIEGVQRVEAQPNNSPIIQT